METVARTEAAARLETAAQDRPRAECAAGHLVQFYQDDSAFLDSLCDFLADGLESGDAVVIIATPEHLNGLFVRLKELGTDVHVLRAINRLVAVEADETLAQFMRNGKVDEVLFEQVIGMLVERAQLSGRPVRAYGEMVALLWQRGEQTATLQLERLWNRFCTENSLVLLCGYPWKAGDGDESDRHRICELHAHVVHNGPQESRGRDCLPAA